MKFVAIFSLVMSIFFIVMGCIIPFYPPQLLVSKGIDGNLLYFVAVILLVYGFFRLSRAIKMLKSS